MKYYKDCSDFKGVANEKKMENFKSEILKLV